jgi:chemotaxis response regulator CheB
LIAIVAGLGGPDAVRQFLAALPTSLPVPVLLWQHLDAGKHDRLVQQLAKATMLPVYLAKAGDLAQPGAVAVMSTGLVTTSNNGLRFAVGDGGASQGLVSALNNPATVIVVLSGAETAIVERARTLSAHGGTVLVQTPATCFDSTAASALEGHGVTVGMPAELAASAVAHLAS